MRVELYTDRESLRPANRQNRQANVNADMFGAKIGQAMAQLGKGIGDWGEAVAYKNEVVATNEARDATYAFRDQINQALYAADGGYMNLQGMAAYNGQESLYQRLTAAGANIAGTLGERGQVLFNAEVDRLMAGVREQVYRRAQSQFQSATTRSGGGGGGGWARSGGSNSFAADIVNGDIGRVAHDETLFGDTLDTALINVEADGVAAGAAPEQIREVQDEIVSRAYEMRIRTQAVEDPVGAMETFQETREMIHAPAALEMYEALAPVATAEQARRAVDAMSVEAAGEAGGDRPVTNASVFAAGEIAGSASYDPPVEVPETLTETPYMPNWMTAISGSTVPTVDLPSSVATVPDGEYVAAIRGNPAYSAMAEATDEEILATRGTSLMEQAAVVSYAASIDQELRTLNVPNTPANAAMLHSYGPRYGAEMLGHVARGTSGITRLIDVMPELGPAAFGYTVGSVYRRVENESRPAMASEYGPVSNHAAMLEVANAHPNPVMREALIREIELRRNIAVADEEERHRQARASVIELLEQNGGRTDLIPLELRQAVGVSTMNELRGQYDAERLGQVVSDEGTLLELSQLSRTDQERFMSLDLNDYGQLLSREDRQYYREMQDNIRRWAEDPLSMITGEEVAAATDRALEVWSRRTGLQVDAANPEPGTGDRVIRFEQQFRHQLEQSVAALGRPLTQPEIDNIAIILTAPATWTTTEPGVLWGERTRTGVGTVAQGLFAAGRDGNYMVDVPIESISADQRARIVNDLSNELGLAPEQISEQDVVQQYGNEMLMQVGVSPTIEFGDIPLQTRLDIQTELARGGVTPTADMVVEEYLSAAMSVAVREMNRR